MDLYLILILIAVTVVIINAILLVKIWLMTNDVNSIKRILQGETVVKEAEDNTNNTVIGVLLGLLVVVGLIVILNL